MDEISFSAKTSFRRCLLQRGVFPISPNVKLAKSLHRTIKEYITCPSDVEPPRHNPKYCPTGPFKKNVVPVLGVLPNSPMNKGTEQATYQASQDVRHRRNEQDMETQSRGGIHFNRDACGNLNVTTSPNPQTTNNRVEGGLRPGFSPWGASSSSTPQNVIIKLKQVENMGKAYTQDSAKFGGGREEDFGSVLLTFQRNLKLFRVDNGQWLSVFPLILKGPALRFYEDNV